MATRYSELSGIVVPLARVTKGVRVRRRSFKSIHGWYDFPAREGLRKRQKKFPDGRWFIEYYDPQLRRTFSSGWTIAVLPRLSSRNAIAMEQDMDLLKKALEARKAAAKQATEVAAEPWMHKIPTIEAWLKTTVIDGKRRETATVTLTLDQGLCKVMFKDRQSHELAWSTGDTFLEALIALEERLGEGTVEWQEDRFYKSGNGKK